MKSKRNSDNVCFLNRTITIIIYQNSISHFLSYIIENKIICFLKFQFQNNTSYTIIMLHTNFLSSMYPSQFIHYEQG